MTVGNISFLLAQFFGFLSGLFYFISGLQKSHKLIMYFQAIDTLFMILATALLHGKAGVIILCVVFIRNLLSYAGKADKKSLYLLMLISAAITILTVDLSKLINWIPIITNLIYTYGVYFSDTAKTKKFMILDVIGWSIYDFHIKSYFLVFIDMLTMIFTFLSLKKHKRI